MAWNEERMREVGYSISLMSTGEDPMKMRFPLQSIESFEFNEVAQQSPIQTFSLIVVINLLNTIFARS